MDLQDPASRSEDATQAFLVECFIEMPLNIQKAIDRFFCQAEIPHTEVYGATLILANHHVEGVDNHLVIGEQGYACNEGIAEFIRDSIRIVLGYRQTPETISQQ